MSQTGILGGGDVLLRCAGIAVVDIAVGQCVDDLVRCNDLEADVLDFGILDALADRLKVGIALVVNEVVVEEGIAANLFGALGVGRPVGTCTDGQTYLGALMTSFMNWMLPYSRPNSSTPLNAAM